MALRYRAMGALAKGLTMGVFGLWVIGTVVWHATIRVMKDSCLAGEVLPKRLLPRQYVEGTALCLRSQQSTKQLRHLLLKRHCASLCRKRKSPCFTAPHTRAVIRKFSSKSKTAPSKSPTRSEEHTSELQSLRHLVCRLL